jgi:HAD superfamily hydrolase (TIGR01509 family)
LAQDASVHGQAHAVGAVIFDLDGVLVDSETIWDDARRAVVARAGGTWAPHATHDLTGMSSVEWSAYLRDRLGVDLPPERISSEVADLVDEQYRARVPLLPGAREVVIRLASEWPLALASSSNRSIIERFLDASGLRQYFTVTVSSEEVAHGKPAPDVYLAAAAGLGVAPEDCAAVEDSTNGIRSASAASMRVIAVPNAQFPPSRDARALATLVVANLDEITVRRVRDLLG